jgi:hypothetical protein
MWIQWSDLYIQEWVLQSAGQSIYYNDVSSDAQQYLTITNHTLVTGMKKRKKPMASCYCSSGFILCEFKHNCVSFKILHLFPCKFLLYVSIQKAVLLVCHYTSQSQISEDGISEDIVSLYYRVPVSNKKHSSQQQQN